MVETLAPITIKDSTGAPKSMVAYTDGVNSAFGHLVLKSDGSLVDPSTSAGQLSMLAQSAPVSDLTLMTALDTTYPAGRYFIVVCSAAGNVSFTLSGGKTIIWPMALGLNSFNMAVTKINTTGTTATATYYNGI